MHIASLWSGGLDSTVMTYFLAAQGYEVTPYRIKFRQGGGKEAREKEALQAIWPMLHDRYPAVQEPIHIVHRMGPSDDRNQKLINVMKDQGFTSIALGSYKDSQNELDNDDLYLSKMTGCTVFTFDTYGINNKQQIVKTAEEIGILDALTYTWSCQLWFKSPCGKCFSCKERKAALGV